MKDVFHFCLENGLQVYFQPDDSTPLVHCNLLYKVGARDEKPDKTGLAHLYEHLMFGGSKHIREFDTAIQNAGGTSNAFTSNDITNYYITLPSANIETALWVESDRMMGLAHNEEVLHTQKKVVMEEFKQRYLNTPYGDIWLHLRPLAYKTHPYQWPTIGKNLADIEQVTMKDIKAFARQFYSPDNAILSVVGNINYKNLKNLINKWFGNIAFSDIDKKRAYPAEPLQKEIRKLEIQASVPLDAIYCAFHMAGRKEENYYVADLISDILGRGKSSRLYQELVIERPIFNNISAFVTGSIDPGLLVIAGKLNQKYSPEEGYMAIREVIKGLQDKKIEDRELEKVKNQAATSIHLSMMSGLERAMKMAYFAAFDRFEWWDREDQLIKKVIGRDIKQYANRILCDNNSSLLFYKSKLE